VPLWQEDAQAWKDKIGRAYSTIGRHEKCIIKLWLGKLKGIDHLRDFGLDRRIILKWMSNWFEECGLD
jgi:hypothetical protein